MRDELYINGKAIELYPGSEIALTYQRNDIAELANRQADYSNTFTIPATNSNNVALNHANTIQGNSNTAYRRLPATFIRAGVPVITNGVAVLESGSSDYEITLYSGIFDFFEQLGDKSLKDIDWSDLNHQHTLSSILSLNSAYLNGTSVVCWPLINWGGYKNNEPVDIKYQQPALKLKEIISRIIAQTNYTAIGEIFNEGLYNDLALTLNPEEQDVSEEDLADNSYSASLTQVLSDAGIPHQGGPSIANLLHYFRTYSGDLTQNIIFDYSRPSIIPWPQGWSSQPKDVSFTRYRSPIYQTVEISIRLFVNHVKLNGNENVRIFKNNILMYLAPIGSYPGGSENDINFFETYTIDLKPGDEIKIQAYGLNINITGITNRDLNELKITSISTIPLYSEVNTNFLVPDLKLKDIVRNFCQLFALIITPSNINNQIAFTKFSEIRRNIDKSEDWTSRLDLSQQPSISYRIGNYAQINWARWAADEITDEFGDSYFQITDTVLEKESTMFSLLFSSCLPMTNIRTTSNKFKPLPLQDFFGLPAWNIQTAYLSGAQVGYNNIIWVAQQNVPANTVDIFFTAYWQIRPDQYTATGPNEGIEVPRYTLFEAEEWLSGVTYNVNDIVNFGNKIWISVIADNLNNAPTVSDPTKWTLKNLQYIQTENSSNRLVLLRALSNRYEPGFGTTIIYTDGVSSLNANSKTTPVAYFSDITQPYNLTFQYLLFKYYPELINMLKNLKVLECMMNLSETDILKLNFLLLKYIENYGNHFYLNKVEDYIQGVSSRCQLIRM